MENLKLPKRIKALRIRKGFSQEELALKTGLSLRTIQRIEQGESTPRGDSIRRLSVALQVSPEEIMDWKIQEDKNVITILNFQMTWSILFFIFYIIFGLQKVFYFKIIPESIFASILFIVILYAYNLISIFTNTIIFSRKNKVAYIPSFKFLK